MDRRNFIKQTLSGLVAFGLGVFGINGCSPAQGALFTLEEGETDPSDDHKDIDPCLDWTVKLGETGLTVPILAMGTGTVGWGGTSRQTQLGMEKFVEIARNAYNRGVRFYDMAEAYGSHRFVAEAIKDLPRGNITLLTKIASTVGLSESETRRKIDAFCQEVRTDYFDIVLMHYITSGGWQDSRKGAMEGLARAKDEGIVKAVGISCHSLAALREAAESSWVDVILTRINPFQSHMDGTPEVINEALAVAQRNGKGVIGMKIFGEGSRVKDNEREQWLRFALTEANIHCMTIGFESVTQMNDAIARISRIQEGIEANT